MKCTHKDCFTCPYPDCVISLSDANSLKIANRGKAETRKSQAQKQARAISAASSPPKEDKPA